MTPRRWLAVRLAVSVAALGVVAAVVGAGAVGAGAAVLRPLPVLAALGLGGAFVALSAARWRVVARAGGAPLPGRQALGEYYRSELLNQVLPGGVLGDVDRARRHATAVGLLRSGRSVLLDRGSGQVVLWSATLVALATRPELLGSVLPGGPVPAMLGLLVLALASVALWWWARRRAVVVRRRDVAAVVVLSATGTACLLTLFALAAWATGTAVGVAELVPVGLVTLVVASIPVGLAGWGTREAGASLAFVAVGLPGAAGVTTSVGFGLLALVAVLPGLLPLVRAHQRVAPQVEVEADVRTEADRS